MPAAVDITVLGDKALAKTMADLPAALQKSLVRKAMRPAGKMLLTAVKSAAPVKTGRLRKSLKLRSITRTRKVVGLKIPAPERSALGIPADAKGYYPWAIEYGAPDRNIAPRAFIRGTVNSNTPKYFRLVREGIKRIMDDEIRNHNKKAAARAAKKAARG